MRIAIPGATGLIGRELVRQLIARGDAPLVLTRDPAAAAAHFPNVAVRRWGLGDRTALQDCDAIVNLAGASIAAGRWTAKRKASIRASRVDATHRLVALLGDLDPRPAVFVAASAVGYYGSQGDAPLGEDAAPGSDFLARVCREVEAEAAQVESFGVRVVSVRTGLVLSGEGGALARMRLPFRLGLGGRIGDGRQWWPWIHVQDIAGIIVHALQSDSLSGPVNGTAPEPVTNLIFTETFARVLGRTARFPLPAWLLRLALGEMASVLTASQRVLPERICGAGYTFAHPELTGALRACLK